jgi:hypothetical protein
MESSRNTNDLTKLKYESKTMQDFTQFKIKFEKFTTAENKTVKYRLQKSAYFKIEYAFLLQLIGTS